MGTWLVSEKIQKKTNRKQRLSLGLGATKPIDHTRARMVSRLAEIKAEVMCCMSTTADMLNHQDPLFQGHGSQLTANEPHPYMAYALIFMTSSLGLLSVNFRQFSTELWPLNDVILSFPLNIFSMNKWILIKFCICNNIYNN